jgi:hypothetical protein
MPATQLREGRQRVGVISLEHDPVAVAMDPVVGQAQQLDVAAALLQERHQMPVEHPKRRCLGGHHRDREPGEVGQPPDGLGLVHERRADGLDRDQRGHLVRAGVGRQEGPRAAGRVGHEDRRPDHVEQLGEAALLERVHLRPVGQHRSRRGQPLLVDRVAGLSAAGPLGVQR